jgi:hypothetical protein
LFHNSKVFGSCIIHILYIYSTNIGTECFKHGVYSPFFSSKCRFFLNSNVFGSCINHILYTECAKIKKTIPAQKGYYQTAGSVPGIEKGKGKSKDQPRTSHERPEGE